MRNTDYYAGPTLIALATKVSFSYLGSDGLGSAVVALDSSGNLQASVLYGTWGGVRYTNGTMPGSYAFTGQQADVTTGLDYNNARSYDLVAKQFSSADTVDDGLNRYAYVHDNPETGTDPSGHKLVSGDGNGRQSSGLMELLLTMFGWVLDGAGRLNALHQQSKAETIKYPKSVIERMFENNHWAKDPGRFARCTGELSAIASPMPLAAPVTMATSPASSAIWPHVLP